MPFAANARHSLALAFIALGAIGVVISAVCLVAGVNAQQFEPGLWACSAVSGSFGLFLIWRAVVMRRRALAQGSTMHLDPDHPVRTTRSGSPRPSFTEKPRREEE
jgi:hypothetical protein